MIKLRMLALACGVALAAGPLAHVAPAQGKPPPQSKQVKKDTFDELLRSYQQGGSYRLVSGDETLTSGDLVTINRKGKDKLTGVFIYSDPKSGKVYIRPKAGQPPIAIPSNEIEKVVRPASGTVDKGGIKPAIETGEKPMPRYEIHTLTVHNGPESTTYYYDTSLSPAEHDQLNALERARADLLRKRGRVESLSQAIEMASAPPVSVVQTGPTGAVAPFFQPYTFYGYYPWLYSPWIAGWPGFNWGWTNYGVDVPAMAYFPGAMGGGAGASTVVVENGGNTAQNVAALTKALNEAETALAESRKNYAAIAQRGVYDNDGRIVAVRLAE